MEPHSFPPFISVLFSGFVLAFIYKITKDQILKRLAVYTLVSFMWWQGVWSILFSIDNDYLADILVRLGYSGIIFVAPLISQFIYYSVTSRRSKLLDYIIYLSFIFLPFIWLTDFFISGAKLNSFGFYPDAGVLHLFHLLLVTISLGFTIIFCLKNVLLDKKSQSKDALISLSFISLAAIDYLVNWGYDFYPFGWIFLVIGLMYIFYSIIFHDYMNIISINIKQTEELKRMNLELQKLANTDQLTGLHNRRSFFEQTNGMKKLLDRNKQKSCFLMMDIDKFKNVNDTYGHDVGDMVIKKFAEITSEHIRGSDIMARWGGEEFVVFLPDTTIDGALTLAEKIRLSVEKYTGTTPQFTVSIGVSELKKNIDSAIKEADNALYEAKNNGRNQVVGL